MSDNAIMHNDNNETRQQIQSEVQAKFAAANDKCGDIIEAYITGGYVENMAKMLVYVGSDRAQAILSKMSEPDKGRLESAYNALSDKKVTDPDVINSVGRVLKEAGFYGETAANAVTAGLSYEQECAAKEMLDRFFEINPLLAMNVETNIYSFDMITDLTDRDVQKLLREVDSIVLAKALRGAATDVKNKILRNMSQRAAANLQEDMDYMGAIRKSDVIEAQQDIIRVIKRLESDGSIVLADKETECV